MRSPMCGKAVVILAVARRPRDSLTYWTHFGMDLDAGSLSIQTIPSYLRCVTVVVKRARERSQNLVAAAALVGIWWPRH